MHAAEMHTPTRTFTITTTGTHALALTHSRPSLLLPKALRTAQLEDFVRGLPEGLDAPVSQEVREASELAVD